MQPQRQPLETNLQVKWSKYSWQEVLNGNDANNNRLISIFAKDYEEATGAKICISCGKFKIDFENFIMKKDTKNTSDYVLKPMFENIQLEFGSNVFVNNENITNKTGAKLLKKHPLGKDLFARVPKTNTSNVVAPEVAKPKVKARRKAKTNTSNVVAPEVAKPKENATGNAKTNNVVAPEVAKAKENATGNAKEESKK